MFSYGFIALGLFVLWFAVAWWTGRRAEGPQTVWVSATLVVALVTFVFYGYDGPQLAVVMVAAAVALRGRDAAVATTPVTVRPTFADAGPAFAARDLR
jgi:hypothetical protein